MLDFFAKIPDCPGSNPKKIADFWFKWGLRLIVLSVRGTVPQSRYVEYPDWGTGTSMGVPRFFILF